MTQRGSFGFDPRFTGKSEPRKQRSGKIADQIAEHGWQGGLFSTADHFGPRTVFFNPAVRLEGKGRPRHLFARESQWNDHWSFAANRITRFDIDGSVLRNPHKIDYECLHPDECWEDPRIIEADGKTFMGVATWIPGMKPIYVNQRITLLDAKDNVEQQWSPVYGKNGRNAHWSSGNEKNWAWFDHDGTLCFVYQNNPHIVVETNGPSIATHHQTNFNGVWKWGEMRGGTNPVRVGDEYLAFFHSSMPWKTIPKYGERRRYFMGAYTFEAKAPFKVKRISGVPLLTGSEFDPVIPGSPAVVFPCGLVVEPSGSLYCTYGINDCAAGWVRMEVGDVMKRMLLC